MAQSSNKSVKIINKGSSLGGVYFLTFIGAAVYFVQNSEGFWGFILAILEAAVWPAFVIHRVLQLLNI